jgi:hypothetical protein
MPFGEMVKVAFLWALAAIPALLMLGGIFLVARLFVKALTK